MNHHLHRLTHERVSIEGLHRRWNRRRQVLRHTLINPLEHGRAADDTIFGIQSLAGVNVALHEDLENWPCFLSARHRRATLCGCKTSHFMRLSTERKNELLQKVCGTSSVSRLRKNTPSAHMSWLIEDRLHILNVPSSGANCAQSAIPSPASLETSPTELHDHTTRYTTTSPPAM